MGIRKLAGIGLLAGIAALAGNAQAAVFTVTKTADTNDGVCDADCSLREAIAAANSNPGADQVNVPAGTYIIGGLGHLLVTEDLTLTGATPVGSTVIEQTVTKRVFQIDTAGGVNADLVNLHVRNGDAAGGISGGDGGCIHNPSGNTLTLTDCLVTDCTAVGDGGGIWNEGTLTVTGTSIEGNQAANGGGIASNGTVSLDNTAVLLNDATGEGGGIRSHFLTIDNSTIAQNTAGSEGAGLRITGPLTIRDSVVRDHASTSSAIAINVQGVAEAAARVSITGTTVSGNSGAGIRLFPICAPCVRTQLLDLVASTVSGNTAGILYSPSFDVPGIISVSHSTITDNSSGGIIVVDENVIVALAYTVVAGNGVSNCEALGTVSAGHNLDDDGSCNFNGPGDLSNVADAGLAPLGDYGGPTPTHALLPGSPAIDAGPAFDQRGAPLHDGDGDTLIAPDLGAYELPEPGFAAMLAAGVLLLPGLVWLRRRRRSRAR